MGPGGTDGAAFNDPRMNGSEQSKTRKRWEPARAGGRGATPAGS